MSASVKIHVVRHGQTDYNLEKRYAGRVDVALNDVGRAQAADLVPLVAAAQVDLVLSSPLRRALETAAIASAGLSCPPVTTTAELAERSLGVYEGLTKQEAAAKYPELFARCVTRLYDDGPTEGETPREVDERVGRLLDRLRGLQSAHNILLVTHGFVAKSIDYYFHPDKSLEEYFSFSVPNAQLMTYELQSELRTV